MRDSSDNLFFAMIGYRLVVVLIGMAFGYLGYKLFVLGIYDKAGELKASWKGAALALRQAAPGTFFALFGAMIVAVALFKPTEIHHHEANPVPTSVLPLHDPAGDNAAFSSDQAVKIPKNYDSIIDKLSKGQNLDKSERDELIEILVFKKAASLSQMNDTDARTYLDNMK